MENEHTMSSKHVITSETPTSQPPLTLFQRWVEDPMRSVIAASVGTMSTLGIVLSGIWAINVVLP
jgi:hypothetical protein